MVFFKFSKGCTLLICIYLTELTCPTLFAILSAADTVSFVSSNEMERNGSLFTAGEVKVEAAGMSVFVHRLLGMLHLFSESWSRSKTNYMLCVLSL